jgi:ATP-dependent DNA helicase PIF1
MNTLQKEAYDAFFRGENLFITGSAGTGKSHVLMQIMRKAKKLTIGLTGTTGSSSHLIGGRTFHSFLGIGLGRGTAQQLAANVLAKNKACAKKLKQMNVLIIEEVSMLDQELFEKASDYLSIVRNNPKPFGGLQVVVLGDFCQLPPVCGNYCFKSMVWRSLNFTMIKLVELVRQHDDPAFQDILEKVRWGDCDEATLRILKSWIREPTDDSVKPTRLYPTNVNVDRINDEEYEKLTADDSVSRQTYATTYGSTTARAWAASSKIPEQVKLCVGAQVVVTWNINQALGIVNGSRGVVIATNASGVLIRDVKGREILIEPVTITDAMLSVTYMPLKLAYALTIHRCQGMTLDCVIIDLGSSIFEYGQAYTALSRVKNSESVYLIDVEASSFKCHPDVKTFYI